MYNQEKEDRNAVISITKNIDTDTINRQRETIKKYVRMQRGVIIFCQILKKLKIIFSKYKNLIEFQIIVTKSSLKYRLEIKFSIIVFLSLLISKTEVTKKDIIEKLAKNVQDIFYFFLQNYICLFNFTMPILPNFQRLNWVILTGKN